MCVIHYLADLLDALQSHVRQHVGLDAPQEDVVIHLVHHLLVLGRKQKFKINKYKI